MFLSLVPLFFVVQQASTYKHVMVKQIPKEKLMEKIATNTTIECIIMEAAGRKLRELVVDCAWGEGGVESPEVVARSTVEET